MSTTAITASDGAVVVYNPNSLWQYRALSQVYLGTTGTGRYCANVGDWVKDTSTNIDYEVTALDLTTLVPTLTKVTTTATGEFTDTDLLLGAGPGTQADTWRCLIDSSATPSRLTVDTRMRVNSVSASYAMIFYGSILKGTATVISAVYDTAGNLLGQKIPLELCAMPNGQNYAVKTISVCRTTTAVADGDVVTAVIYSSEGAVLSTRQLIVTNTAFIRSTDSSQKFITGISLESPFLSDSDPTKILYPLNTPVTGLNLYGVVNYSTGEKLKLPVDGTKFSAFGLDGFLSTIVGQQMPLLLKYSLAENEIVYDVTANVSGNTVDHFITEEFTIISEQADGAYTVKLFGYPVWVDITNGYTLKWYLLTLDRKLMYDVTSYVAFSTNSPAWKPLSYGVQQNLQVQLDLSKVNGVYKKYIHAQTIGITLMRAGNDHTATNWTVAFDPLQSPEYGVSSYASVHMNEVTDWQVDLSQGLTDYTAWLTKLYYNSKPLYDPDRESGPVVPNMFSIITGTDTEVEFNISQWNSTLHLTSSFTDSATMYVKFFKRMSNTDLILSIVGLPIYTV